MRATMKPNQPLYWAPCECGKSLKAVLSGTNTFYQCIVCQAEYKKDPDTNQMEPYICWCSNQWWVHSPKAGAVEVHELVAEKSKHDQLADTRGQIICWKGSRSCHAHDVIVDYTITPASQLVPYDRIYCTYRTGKEKWVQVISYSNEPIIEVREKSTPEHIRVAKRFFIDRETGEEIIGESLGQRNGGE